MQITIMQHFARVIVYVKHQFKDALPRGLGIFTTLKSNRLIAAHMMRETIIDAVYVHWQVKEFHCSQAVDGCREMPVPQG